MNTSWARADLERKEEARSPELPKKAFHTALMVTTQKGEQRKLLSGGACHAQTHSAAAARMVWAQCVAAVQQLNALPHVSHTAVAICVWWMCGVQWGAEEATAPPHFCYFKWLWICQGCGHWSLLSCYGLWTAKLKLGAACPFPKRGVKLCWKDMFPHILSMKTFTVTGDHWGKWLCPVEKSIKYLLKWAFQVIYQ